MMQLPSQVSSVAQVIQLAVALFVLAALHGDLPRVLARRPGRERVRFHVLEKSLVSDLSATERAQTLSTILSLSRRARMIHWAISLCTACDLLVCLVVVALFVGAELQVELSRTIAGLFIAAMLALIAGLTCFLREIALATNFIEDLDKRAASIDGQSGRR